MGGINLWLILPAALMAQASPGPATIAIAATAMRDGRPRAMALAAGIITGSLIWSVSAALGLGAAMFAHGWIVEFMRYIGAAYLLYLGVRSARSALQPSHIAPFADHPGPMASSCLGTYLRGLGLHLTNPKAILFFGALYAVGLPQGTPLSSLVVVIVAIGVQTAVVNFGYALLFSRPGIARGYFRLRRWFDGVFAVFFAYAGIRVLTARL